MRLCANAYACARIVGFCKANGFSHQGIANFQAAELGQGQDTANGRLFVLQARLHNAGIGSQLAVLEHGQMPGIQIQAVNFLVRASLLHDKHGLASLDDCVHFPRGQIVQPFPLKIQVHLCFHDDSDL